jgi:hypothetical protein
MADIAALTSIDFASFIGLAIPKKVSAYATGMRE